MPPATPVRAFMRTFKTAFNRTQVRNQSTLQLHKHDNMQQARKIGRTAAVYFPFYAVVLGWPMLISSYGKRYGIWLAVKPVLIAFNGMGRSTMPAASDINAEEIVQREDGHLLIQGGDVGY